MAVAKRTKPDTDEQITLDDGQAINLSIKQGNFTQGDREANAELFENLQFASQRLEKLKGRSIDAADDATYEKNRTEYKRFKGKLTLMLKQVDRFIISLVTRWDLSLTEEDEEKGIRVPLTVEGLASLEDVLKMDIFTKLILLPSSRSNDEKKDSSVSYNGDVPIQKDAKEVSQASMPDTLLQ